MRILHTGDLGSASVLKVVTNFLATANLITCAEALVTCKAAGMDMESVQVGGVDASQDALVVMAAGDYDVTVFQDSVGQGTGSIDAALKLIAGEDVDSKVYIPFVLVTPDNMNDFLEKN